MSYRRIATLCCAAMMFVAAGCSTTTDADQDSEAKGTESSASAQSEQESQSDGGAKKAQMCPMAVEGTSVEAKKIKNGVAMDYTTSGDVKDVRKRAKARVEMHNAFREKMTRGGPKQGMAMSKVAFDNIEGGARIFHSMPGVENAQKSLYESLSKKAQKMNETQSCLMKTSHGGDEDGE